MTVKHTWRRLVAEIEAAGTRQGRERLGACSLEGTRLFERALRAGVRIERAITTLTLLDEPTPREADLLAALEAQGCTPVVVPEDVLQGLTQGRSSGAFVGLARLPAARSLEQVLAEPPRRPALLLGCVGGLDPGNVGALVRTAHASGAAAFLAVETCDPFHPQAVRTSMGSVWKVPVIERRGLGGLVRELSEVGVRTFGAVSTQGTPLPRLAPSNAPTALFLGSEAFGLAPEEQAELDELVTIPMPKGVDSYSINAAAAVLLYALGGEGG